MLELRSVSKQINGNVILDDINLKLFPGKIYGIVGKSDSCRRG